MGRTYLVLLVLCFDFAFGTFISKRYAVPEPTVVVYSPKGFEVRIPHEDGVNLFAFHGNINREMENLEAGQFSKDILRKKGNQWIFEDKHTQLKMGDTIYYWLFVIKDHLGYRYDHGVFTVKDIIPRPQSDDRQIYDETPTEEHQTQAVNGGEDVSKTNPMCILKKNLTDTVRILERDIQVNTEVIDILKQLINKDDTTSRTLKFEGRLPPADDDASYVARMIVSEKLGSSIHINQASWDGKGHITFQVDSLDDKVALIRIAKEKLAKSKIRLVY